jgi:predicted dehydrogenase
MGASLKPRLGFAGLGWIGQLRLRALVEADVADVVAICDPRTESTLRVAADLPGVRSCASLEELLEQPVDGIVIATPSALHATQAIACLDAGYAVFCQKPLARSRDEAVRVVDAARRAERLLSVDMSYRFAAAVLALKRLVDTGALGVVHTADLVFHNAYGPDQPWYYARDLAGGGCLMDLGVHLVDHIKVRRGTGPAVSKISRTCCSRVLEAQWPESSARGVPQSDPTRGSASSCWAPAAARA